MDLNQFQEIISQALPLWVLGGAGLVTLLADSLLGRRGQGFIYTLGILSLLGTLVLCYQRWMSGSFESTQLVVMDSLSLFLMVIVVLTGLFTLLNAYSYVQRLALDPHDEKGILNNAFVTLVLFSVFGMVFLFASDHLIVNFIGLEIMSLSIYILVGSHTREIVSKEGAIKYFVMGSVASAILLFGIVLLYAVYGSFQLGDIRSLVPAAGYAGLLKIAIVFVLVGVFFKLSIAPFHFWAPDVYEGAPAPVTGFMATGVKVAAAAFLIRILTSFSLIPQDMFLDLLKVGFILTVLVGNLGAVMQDNVKRMLAYSSIAHAGYLFLGFVSGFHDGRFDTAVLPSILFYLLSYSLMTLGAFAVLCALTRGDREATQFRDLKSLGKSRPVLAFTFSLFMISFLGLPPTVGFIAKYGIFVQAIQNGYIELAIFGILTSVVSAYYYLRPLVMMYFYPDESHEQSSPVSLPLTVTLAFCFVAVLYLGFKPTQYLHMAQMAVGALK